MSDVAIPLKIAPEKKQINADPEIYDYLNATLGSAVVSDLSWEMKKNGTELPYQFRSTFGFVNPRRMNDIPQINRFLADVNNRLTYGQYLVVTMETKEARKERILNKFPKLLSYPYYVLDFILKRVFPKWKPTRRLYFYLTNGRNRVMSLSEGLARLICCGFEIVDFRKTGVKTTIIGRKIKKPSYDKQRTYGTLIRLNRIGKDGLPIKVYKLRTMHPYSEYLQDFVFEHYHLSKSGKFNNDFRRTTWGRVFRKYWIDELPMLINWFKGELKLVGVRPLSCQYYELYPEDLRARRIKNKPGLIPPYYADMPKVFEEILESERNYLESYEKNPFLTDLRYFLKVFVNIAFRGARSE